ncbi:hypothetical protein Y1Q_0000984 [Alligator mississippiensis]|uniref:Uncharacterized protein n=1 Tax=Alligator mississippiensis TaxID=8496 RepID=A0A151NE53_ALLMI|nr:hypothetical protein Y1Q_0000984 [Alligator mississippiensis]
MRVGASGTSKSVLITFIGVVSSQRTASEGRIHAVSPTAYASLILTSLSASLPNPQMEMHSSRPPEELLILLYRLPIN